ncbi:MAG: DEAD/DEAH box helicase [Candidatus Marsarchaeota archaeon]|jgi:helicase|nr:DEAD/DEAH box helicase [Candidatus Marsarchaeota archaeon]MCL5419090.1 DEAD/DEAH box helicase [Candidatus Marsarchaeota archaeon]
MQIRALQGKLPNEVVESLQDRGIVSLTPPQELAIQNGVLSGKSMLIASPTASGKTLVAELACMNAILGKGMKAVYIAPMRALATEKFEEFKHNYPYIKAAISIGDLDADDPWLSEYEMMFFSTEKFDSLMRHGINWLHSLGCVVFDEVHMLGDTSRGPTLELLITKLKETTRAQVIALSATVGNAEEIAKWLDARLVTSDYRPVPLLKGVMYNGEAYYVEDNDYRRESIDGDSGIPEIKIVQDTLKRGKQALLFYSTKRNAEAGAAKLADHVSSMLSESEAGALKGISNKVLNTLSRPTEQCKKLSMLVRSGVAFHHAGLLNQQRAEVEHAFKSDLIKVICATPTLSLGINMPAHTVVVRDITRYENGMSERLGVNEVMQLFGRAGRPSYDKEGRALLLASTKERMEELTAQYILAKPEPIESALGIAPVLRSHVLSFIAEGFLTSRKSILDFMFKTFYSYQFGNKLHIENMIDDVLEDLQAWSFILKNGVSYTATRLGKRISELYIDPLSAKLIIEALEGELDSIGTLFMVANTLEMRPYARVTQEAEEEYAIYMHRHKRLFRAYDYESMDPVGAFSTALMLNEWASETKEQDIVKKYSVTPGALYSKITNADWLIYAAIEIAKILRKRVNAMIDMRVRLRYGIKEELMDLVRLAQVGRVRARLLFDNGITSVSDVRNSTEKVKLILGKETAEMIFRENGIEFH